MIRRLYVHNFRCLENFELPIGGLSSALLIGNNGSGKSTVGRVLEILQRIGRGTNRIGELVSPGDFSRGRTDVPMRFEIELDLEGEVYAYTIAFELPPGFKELRVFEEKLVAGDDTVYSRKLANIALPVSHKQEAVKFTIDWHLIGLSVIQEKSNRDPLSLFKQWLRRMLILRPIPSLILGDSTGETLEPKPQLVDFGAWFAGLFNYAPSTYRKIDEYLKQLMPDLKDIRNPSTGADSKRLEVQFSTELGSVVLPFADLSDGEKCFLICALVLGMKDAFGTVFCFWDEPDNYLALSEVGHFVMALRRSFLSGGQFLATSHNPEAIRRFSDDNTFVLHRKNHLEPTLVRVLKEIQIGGDLVSALIRGDVEL